MLNEMRQSRFVVFGRDPGGQILVHRIDIGAAVRVDERADSAALRTLSGRTFN
ncbi:hypothetical protein [Nocardia colli]|uniref:hypothetical protein n=1 Tax=Nocardia colli TaxID=2545717 RepID=UPI00168D3F63|nr:hypothetical protein [Nocardia colli]